MKIPATPLEAFDGLLTALNPRLGAVGFHRAAAGYRGQPRGLVLEDFDLWYVAAGAGEVRLDGLWHRFAAGDLLVLKPGTLYERDNTDDHHPFQVYFAHLEPFGDREETLSAALGQLLPLRLPLSHRPEVEGLFRHLIEACVTRPPHGALTGRGLVLQVLQIAVDEALRPAGGMARSGHPAVNQARDLIESDYASALNLDRLAASVGLSPGHLCTLFRRQYGLPPMEYLQQRRLREARVLLARGLRVNEVARAVGYASQHYFSRTFRKHFGVPPREFGQRHAWATSGPEEV